MSKQASRQTELHQINVKLSDGQKRKIAKGYRDREEVSVRLGKNALSGNDTLFVPNNTVRRLAKSKRDNKGMVVKITKGNIRKQFGKSGAGGPKLGKSGAGGPRIGSPRIGSPRIGSPPWRPPPFIGNWGDRQYGANVFSPAMDGLNQLGEWFVDTVKKKKNRKTPKGQKGGGADWLKYLLGPKNFMTAYKKS